LPDLRRSSGLTLFPYTTLFRSKFEVEDVRRALGPYSRLRFDALMEEWYELHPQLKLATGVLKGMPAAFRLDKILPQVDDLCLSRSEEHTSELQSRENLVCRLLL